MNNPFNITKAVDYTDDDIIRYWVDISNDGFQNLLKPKSLMPMLILGSKGSGKTHLMRFFSYQLQKIRHKDNFIEGVISDGYIGIYLRCSGLNSDRFKGKGQQDEVWNTVFSYYMELWVAQLLLDTIKDFEIDKETQKLICNEVISLFEKELSVEINEFHELKSFIKDLQNKVDYSVNNSAITRNLNNLEILLSPGKLILGMPKIFGKYISSLSKTVFLYLIDELENITEEQQKLINTWYREKEHPVTFRLGARLYGIKTYKTLGGAEENKEGSEYEKTELDSFYRNNDAEYETFIRKVCYNRLNEDGFNISNPDELDSYFEAFDLKTFLNKIKKKKYSQVHIDRVQKELLLDKKYKPEIIEKIISNLKFSDDILIEKTNMFLFYRDWNDRKELVAASESIKKEANDFVVQQSKGSRHAKILSYFKFDLIDQLARDSREKIHYVGFSTFVKMSSGIPRNLLNILKHTYRWSYFGDNIKPFKNGLISIDSQLKGVTETSDWFFEDNRIPSEEGKIAFNCITRIGRLLQDIRYSDIPPECSISSFSLQYEKLNAEGIKIIDMLEKYSFLLVTNNRRDKNSNEYLKTYKFNGIISPKWELSLNKRGVININEKELVAIFETKAEDLFLQILADRKNKYNAPFSNNNSLSLF